MQFNGATEYYSYQGLYDGFWNLKMESEAYDYINSMPLGNLAVTKECQNCYILGYLLGKEIRRYAKEELTIKKESRHGIATDGPRETFNELDGFRPSMG